MSSTIGNKTDNMSTPFFHELKKQASFFLKEKIKTARLALTDVTPAELLTEEATNGNPWAPETRTMKIISRAAFEVDDYWRIVKILHKRLVRFDRTNWRVSYKALIILEHLLTHGPESVAEEFQSDRDVIHEMENFQNIDERGFDWGLTVRKKSERLQLLLERGPLLKQERDRSRKLSRGIQGFGSFCNRSSTEEWSSRKQSSGKFRRSNTNYNDSEQDQFQFLEAPEKSQLILGTPVKDLNIAESSNNVSNLAKLEFQEVLKENILPAEALLPRKLCEEDCMIESNSLLSHQNNELKTTIEEDHPFNDHDQQSTASLL
ncbi:Epsin-2 [Thalictrum thalictroides]|uniref:Epsin-2 n=1 Tax=Thalictrum thalictroides TaxID=46969 RepID=A0A7J6VXV5_THATH|nr:Epsin-2 [Thalictrum thalictroides]